MAGWFGSMYPKLSKGQKKTKLGTALGKVMNKDFVPQIKSGNKRPSGPILKHVR